eukprot:364372-Chlamydomonas_euryale.AAC.5
MQTPSGCPHHQGCHTIRVATPSGLPHHQGCQRDSRIGSSVCVCEEHCQSRLSMQDGTEAPTTSGAAARHLVRTEQAGQNARLHGHQAPPPSYRWLHHRSLVAHSSSRRRAVAAPSSRPCRCSWRPALASPGMPSDSSHLPACPATASLPPSTAAGVDIPQHAQRHRCLLGAMRLMQRRLPQGLPARGGKRAGSQGAWLARGPFAADDRLALHRRRRL